jgi:hypothetical protein
MATTVAAYHRMATDAFDCYALSSGAVAAPIAP